MRKVLYILYQPYKWLVLLPLFVISTVFFILLGMVILLFFDDNTGNRIAGGGWARFNRFITSAGVDVIGRGHVKAGQSYVVVTNHQSLFDIFVPWGYLWITTKWVMKKELREIPPK
ncbi:MAG: hypothetical protein JW950_03765 [Deltaproteobacteria bacterium]|nr:hypothetical protein [Deltaproteobacteria bacterium]